MKEKTSFLYGILFLFALLHIFPLVYTSGRFLVAFTGHTVLYPIVCLLGMMLVTFLIFKERIIKVKLTIPLFLVIMFIPFIIVWMLGLVPIPQFIYLKENAVNMDLIPTIIHAVFMASITVLAFCRWSPNKNNGELVSEHSIDKNSFYSGIACYMFVSQLFWFTVHIGRFITGTLNIDVLYVLGLLLVTTILVFVLFGRVVSKKMINIAPNKLIFAATLLMIFFSAYASCVEPAYDHTYFVIKGISRLFTFVFVTIAFVYYRKSLRAGESLALGEDC